MPNRTLIGGLKSHAERSVNDLRDYETPPPVNVYRATPDGKLGEYLRTESALPYTTDFNPDRKRK